MSFFKNLFSNLFSFFKPVAVATAKELGQVALNAVVAEVPKVISGQEKFNSAVQNVKGTLLASGKSAALSLIEVAVQAAYEGLKAK
jgi:hypothetical protein